MNGKSLFTFVVIISIVNSATANHQQQRINISIYYETECIESVFLIQRQIKPVWTDLHDYVNLTFVPYGKAVQNRGNDSLWTFDCQHGPHECHGNKIQACAFDLLQNDSDKSVNYAACFMVRNNFYPYNTTCFEDTVGTEHEKMINNFKSCVNSTKGDEILAVYGDMTHAVNPSITSVPALVINGVQDVDTTRKAESDFRLVICNLLQEPKPSPCDKYNL